MPMLPGRRREIQVREVFFYILMQRFLVTFQGKQIVRLLFYYLVGYFVLAPLGL